MNAKRYIPTLPQISTEVLAVLIGTVVAAWLISQFPALQRLVRNSTPLGPFNP